jgi:hypothetical protein
MRQCGSLPCLHITAFVVVLPGPSSLELDATSPTSVPPLHCTRIPRLEELVQDLQERVAQGEVLYVHCWGGRGRAGLVGASYLAAAYGCVARCAVFFSTVCRQVAVAFGNGGAMFCSDIKYFVFAAFACK